MIDEIIIRTRKAGHDNAKMTVILKDTTKRIFKGSRAEGLIKKLTVRPEEFLNEVLNI